MPQFDITPDMNQLVSGRLTIVVPKTRNIVAESVITEPGPTVLSRVGSFATLPLGAAIRGHGIEASPHALPPTTARMTSFLRANGDTATPAFTKAHEIVFEDNEEWKNQVKRFYETHVKTGRFSQAQSFELLTYGPVQGTLVTRARTLKHRYIWGFSYQMDYCTVLPFLPDYTDDRIWDNLQSGMGRLTRLTRFPSDTRLDRQRALSVCSEQGYWWGGPRLLRTVLRYFLIKEVSGVTVAFKKKQAAQPVKARKK